MLVPGLNYAFETFIHCLSEKGISDTVKVCTYSIFFFSSQIMIKSQDKCLEEFICFILANLYILLFA